MYVVTGATGHTGSVITETLLTQGKKVRVIGRDAKRLERFVQRGADAFEADMEDAEALRKAFSGAQAVYAMIPSNPGVLNLRAHQNRVSDALAFAIGTNRVPHAVVLSSIGADKPDKTGPVVGLHMFEKKLDAIPALNALYLRPGYFMENLLPQVGVIQSFGIVAGPLRPDLALPMIATRDIGAVAAQALLKLDFQGKRSRELLGPLDVTYTEVARVIGAAIGKPDLAYRQMPGEQLKPVFMQMGMSSDMADQILELAQALNSGHMKALEPRSPANATPTTIETFVAEVFVPAYRAKAAHA